MIKKIIFTSLIAICGLLMFYSCDGMNDLHDPYLEEGEIVYAPRVDSAKAQAGNMRLAINIFAKSQRIEKAMLYWNNRRDSIAFSLEGVSGSVPKVILIDNLVEQSYNFTVITSDINGNKSLPTDFVGTVYGIEYASALLNRPIERTEREDVNAVIYWREGGEYLGVEMKYTNNKGVEKIIAVAPDEIRTVVEDAVSGENFTYKTFYRPEHNAIDVFESMERTHRFP